MSDKIYVVESTGGGIYLGKSSIPIYPSSSPVILTDCFVDDFYIGTCNVIVCAVWQADEEGIEVYNEMMQSLAEDKE